MLLRRHICKPPDASLLFCKNAGTSIKWQGEEGRSLARSASAPRDKLIKVPPLLLSTRVKEARKRHIRPPSDDAKKAVNNAPGTEDMLNKLVGNQDSNCNGVTSSADKASLGWGLLGLYVALSPFVLGVHSSYPQIVGEAERALSLLPLGLTSTGCHVSKHWNKEIVSDLFILFPIEQGAFRE